MKIDELVQRMVGNELEDLHVAIPAKIEKYDPEKLKASVVLLAKKEFDGDNYTIPPIIEVPVMTFGSNTISIRPPYAKGDVVQVLFNERALDKLLITGDPEDPEIKRRHSIDDAVIIGSLKKEQSQKFPSSYTEDFLIWNKETDEKVIVKKSSGVTIESEDIKLGSDSASDALALLSKLVTLVGQLQGHTHPYSWTDGGGSAESSPPSQSFTTDLGATKVTAE